MAKKKSYKAPVQTTALGMPVRTDQPAPFSGSLSQFNNVTVNTSGPQQYVGPVTPGGTKMPTPNRGADTGMFAGSGTPLNSSIGMQDTSRKHVTNVIKNLAIQEVGGAAIAYGVTKTANAIHKSGLANRALNAIRGEEVIVHGTGRPVVGNYLNPAKSPISPDVPTVSGWNTSHEPGNTTWIHNAVGEYAQKPWYKEGVQMPSERNVVIAKTKINSRIKAVTENNPAQIASTEPAKIVKVVKYGYKKEDVDAIAKAIKMAGGKQPSRAAKAEAAALAARKRAEMYDGGVA